MIHQTVDQHGIYTQSRPDRERMGAGCVQWHRCQRKPPSGACALLTHHSLYTPLHSENPRGHLSLAKCTVSERCVHGAAGGVPCSVSPGVRVCAVRLLAGEIRWWFTTAACWTLPPTCLARCVRSAHKWKEVNVSQWALSMQTRKENRTRLVCPHAKHMGGYCRGLTAHVIHSTLSSAHKWKQVHVSGYCPSPVPALRHCVPCILCICGVSDMAERECVYSHLSLSRAHCVCIHGVSDLSAL
jgi:hypothetical protein